MSISLFVVVKILCLIAFVTMIIIQLVKVPLKRFYHRNKVTAWLSGYYYPLLPTAYLFIPAMLKRLEENRGSDGIEIGNSLETLIRLSTAGNSYALFQLSIEQLCGQLLAAVQTIFNDPQNYRELLIALARPPKNDFLNADIDMLSPAPNNDKKNSLKKKKQQQAYLAAQSRVHSAIQRRIDSLQISGAIEWRAWLKFMATIIAAGITVIMFYYLRISEPLLLKIIIVLVVAPVAGYVASVLRDIIAVVERLRN